MPNTFSETWEKVKKYTEELLNKATVDMWPTVYYYAVQDKNILVLGGMLPNDAVDEIIDSADKYMLIVSRGEHSWDLKYTAEKMEDGATLEQAQERALKLVEGRNNVKTVTVCIGLNKTFAKRPIYKGIIYFSLLSRADFDEAAGEMINKIYSSVDDVPDSVPKNKRKQFLEVWNSAYKKTGSEASAFRQAWGVINKEVCKGQPDATDVHVDGVTKLICPVCDKEPCTCSAEDLEKSSAAINDLPDSDFAYVESGGKKDEGGKTVPRSKRHFPIHDANHVRNALARANQSEFGKKALPKIIAAAKKFGIKISQGMAAESVKKEEFECFIELNKSSLVEGLVYGIVYEPMKKDSHGDWTTADEIEKWANSFLPRALANGTWTNKNHNEDLHDVEIAQSYVAPCNFEFPNGQHVTKGSWVVVSRVNNAELRKAIEDGEVTGYSLEGVGRKVDMDF